MQFLLDYLISPLFDGILWALFQIIVHPFVHCCATAHCVGGDKGYISHIVEHVFRHYQRGGPDTKDN